MKGRVYLVGAGCSSADLITVRGKRLIESCQVLIYDDLIDKALLEMAPKGALLIPVGKRGGCKSARQEDINALLVEHGLSGKMVVRLKGGDPFVFGRGGEEAMALMEADIPFSVVPGISSGIAVPMEAGIPVSHRGIARSIHFITGHTKDSGDSLPEDIEELSKLHGTLVFFMGISHIGKITESLIKYGKDPKTPAAVVSGGNSENPVVIRGSLGEIARLAKENGAASPAIIMVGQVCSMDLSDKSAMPLSGVTVGLTGTESFCNNLRPLLWDKGAKIVQIQKATCSHTYEIIPYESISDARSKWVVFLSANGVRMFFERMKNDGQDIRILYNSKIAVIGEATGSLLRENYGIIPDLCPEVYTKEALTEELIKRVDGERVFIFDSNQGSMEMADKLLSQGIQGERYSIYDTVYETAEPGYSPDFIFFGSAGAVKALKESGYEISEGTKPVCIGPVAQRALAGLYGLDPIVPEKITAASMVEAACNL